MSTTPEGLLKTRSLSVATTPSSTICRAQSTSPLASLWVSQTSACMRAWLVPAPPRLLNAATAASRASFASGDPAIGPLSAVIIPTFTTGPFADVADAGTAPSGNATATISVTRRTARRARIRTPPAAPMFPPIAMSTYARRTAARTLAIYPDRVPSAAVEAFGVGGEELVAGLGVAIGRHLVEAGLELVVGAVHGVDGEVAREHAPIDAERRETVLEPRAELVAIHRVQGHGEPGQLAVHVVTQRSEGRDAALPEVELLGAVRSRPAGVLDDDREVVPVGQRRGGGFQLVGVRHQLEDEVALRERAEHLCARDPHAAAHRPDTPEARRFHLRVEQTLGVRDRISRHDAPDDGVGVPGRLGHRLELGSLRRRVGRARGGDVHELDDA